MAGLGFLLLLSMVLSTTIQIVTKWANDELQMVPLGPLVGLIQRERFLWYFSAAVSGLMRMDIGVKPKMRHLLMGAIMGAALFTVASRRWPGICRQPPWSRPMARRVRWWWC